MKQSNKNILNLVAFVALIICAVLGVFDILAHFGILNASGGLLNLLKTVKNICILVVVGFAGYAFVDGRSKGYKITYWVSMVVILVCTVLLWL